MAGTASVSVTTGAYVSLGTGPMIISPEDEIMIVANASQPAASVVGHALGVELRAPFPFTLSEQVWAIATHANCAVIVTT